jgi:hypothetical protein
MLKEKLLAGLRYKQNDNIKMGVKINWPARWGLFILSSA